MKSVLEIIGPAGVGKTTLCELLIQWLEAADNLQRGGHSAILIIDASPDSRLTRDLAEKESPPTLAALEKSFQDKPTQQNEAIDWACQDLIQSINPQIDLLTVGTLPSPLASGIEKMVVYGLKRLFTTYDVIIIDGEEPFLRDNVFQDPVQSLIVITPDCWDARHLHPEGCGITSAVFMANQCSPQVISGRIEGELGIALDEALDEERIRLVAKIPRYESEAEMNEALPRAFHNGLLRMDLPFTPTPPP